MKTLCPALDLDCLLPTLRILATARQVPPGDKFVHALLVPGEVPCMRSGVNRRMGLVVFLASSRIGEAATSFEAVHSAHQCQVQAEDRKDRNLTS